MSKFLIVDDEADLRDILRFVLEAKYKVEILEAGSGEEALEILRQHPDIEMIFSDYGMPNGNGAVVFNYNKNAKNIPFFLFTGATLEDCEGIKDFHKTHIKNCLIGKPFEDDFLFTQIEKAIPNISNDQSLTSTHDYKRLPLDFVAEYVHYSPAVYIKLSDRFIKIFHRGDLQSSDDIKKYLARGEKFCYLQKNDFKEFIFQITDEIQKKVSAKAPTAGSVDKAAMDTALYLQQACKIFGIKEAQQRIIHACVESCVKNLHTPPKLQEFAKDIFTKNNYLGAHSLFSIHISYLISRNLNFDFFGQQLLDKFTFAGILHDISLEEEEYSEIFDTNHPKFAKLTALSKEKLKQHPNESAKLSMEIRNVPQEVATMIREHHERPDGSGFPRGLGANAISLLGAIYIVALKVADFISVRAEALSEESFDNLRLELKSELLQNYYHGQFRKVVDAFLKGIDMY